MEEMLRSIETLSNEAVLANHVGSEAGSSSLRTVKESRRRKRKNGAGGKGRGTPKVQERILVLAKEVEALQRTLREEREDVARLTLQALEMHRQITDFNRETVDFKSEQMWHEMRW